MKILTLTPEALADLRANEPGAVTLLPDPEGPPEYAITLPVPSPEDPGEYVLLTVTPDGRTAAVIVDDVRPGELVVRGLLRGDTVVLIPKEAPWMMLDRALLRFMTKDEVRKATVRAYRGTLGPEPGGVCPVHGVPEPGEPGGGEVSDYTGQYL